ncbi:MAG: hypothetical protein U1F67_21405 [Rubrivivax sp.]
MKLKSLAVAVALAATASFASAATCSSTGNLGDLTPPDLAQRFSRSYSAAPARTWIAVRSDVSVRRPTRWASPWTGISPLFRETST